MPGLYIHIPFCERKCIYCDFYSIESMTHTDAFFAALSSEMMLYRDLVQDQAFSTIFLGGGTPSIISSSKLKHLLAEIRGHFKVDTNAEITLETNPGTVDREKLDQLRAMGFNRISIGVQSFHEDELRFLGRIHTAGTSVQCCQWAREAGFENLSIDLIFSLPGQSRDRWAETLRRGIELRPKHVSAYSLIIEEGTPLARMVSSGRVAPLPPEEDAELYSFTIKFLASHGYQQYEVSNFCRPGFQSRHNSGYWNHEPYLGLGPSAHSYWGGKRWWNAGLLQPYIHGLSQGQKPIAGEETLTPSQLRDEAVMLGVRTGVLDFPQLKSRYGLNPTPGTSVVIRRLVGSGRATFVHETLRITSRGFPFCDEISVDLLASL